MVASPSALVHRLRRWVVQQSPDATSDARLLERFVRDQDEDAFAALVSRHGPMVLRLCRRVLGDAHAAEDAFQACFLVLARRAASLRPGDVLPAWLHGVALRVALKARAADRRRSRRETSLPDVSQADPTRGPLDELSARELLTVFHEELQRLPQAYRLPVLLCCVEGLSQEEAAHRLGWTPGSVKGRLERGRKRLQTQLARRGLTLAAAMAAVEVSRGVAGAAALLSGMTAQVALAFAAGEGEAIAGVSADVALLAEGSLKGMTLAKGKLGVLFLLAVSMVASGASLLSHQAPAARPPDARPPVAQEPVRDKREEKKPPGTDRYGDPLPVGALARLGTVRLRPGPMIGRLAFSPGAKRIACCAEGSFSLWDAATGRELRRVDLPNVLVLAFSWLADGRGLAVLQKSFEGKLSVWDFTDEQAVPSLFPGFPITGMNQQPAAEGGHYGCFAIAPNGRLLAGGVIGSADKDRPVHLWDLATGWKEKGFKANRLLGMQPGNCRALLFTPDSRSLLVLSHTAKAKGDTLSVWNVAGGVLRKQMTVPRASDGIGTYIPAIAVAPDGDTVGLGLPDGTVRLWDVTKAREVRSLTVAIQMPGVDMVDVPAVAFSPDGKYLVTGSRDNLVRVWELPSGRQVHALKGHARFVEALAMSADGKRIASGGPEGLIRLWDAATGADGCPLEAHPSWVDSVVATADGRTVATVSRFDSTLRWWDINSGRKKHFIGLSDWTGGPLTLTPEGKALVGNVGDRLRLWDVTTGKAIPTAGPLADQPCTVFRFAAAGKTLVTAHENKVSVWEWPAVRLVRTITLADDQGKVHCLGVAVSADGRLLLTRSLYGRPDNNGHFFFGRGFGAVDLWDVSKGRRLRRLAQEDCDDAVFAPDGSGVMVVGMGPGPGKPATPPGNVRLLDLTTGQTRRIFASPPQGVRGLIFPSGIALYSPDGRTLANLQSRTVWLFEASTGLQRRQLTGHRAPLSSLAFTPDGKRLVTGSYDNTALVWDVSLATMPRQTNSDPRHLWADLASGTAERANGALAGLASRPALAITVLKDRLRPATAADATELDRLVVDLGSAGFKVREKAFSTLDRLGVAAVPGLRARLAKVQVQETRRRMEQLLAKHDPELLPLARVRELRALEVLEQIGTPEARQLLEALAGGAAEAWLTREARVTRDRLVRRSLVTP